MTMSSMVLGVQRHFVLHIVKQPFRFNELQFLQCVRPNGADLLKVFFYHDLTCICYKNMYAYLWVQERESPRNVHLARGQIPMQYKESGRHRLRSSNKIFRKRTLLQIWKASHDQIFTSVNFSLKSLKSLNYAINNQV